ncbi:hypothetical protein [Paraburkholderia sp. CNPSo 3281]|uniref:hypothetical protein n=1 Tax=Paraburkholderia sp. CNPSo 3281 TaxID=2940933 RepID=UPI0020B85FCE|nr:hypothetical protein [Paraburkholderia sp. CNPSo 3281]MCP3716891.1 hypothetical protein [Paraburkholderia sp. CNPSo 3281]
MAYKTSALTLVIIVLACEMAGAAEPAASDCANDECVVFVNDKPPAAQALCGDAAVTIRWTVGENVFLTTCEDAGTEEQNTNFLSDASGNYARKLVYGRPVQKQFLRQHPTGPVPDKFAPRPYCTPPLLQQVSASTFVLLDKRPENTNNGYCFEPTYVHYDKGQSIDTAKARIATGDRDYFGTLPTTKQQLNLATLIHGYGAMSHQTSKADEASPLQERTSHVAVERAWLYDKPEENGKRKGYLIGGDTVAVLDEVGGWARIHYRQINGNEIVRWVRSADLVKGP